MTSTLFTGGRVWTGHREVEALLVENGRVLRASDRSTVERERPTGAETVDLAGRSVIPGLIDAHVHLTDLSLQDRGVDLRGARSLQEVQGRLEEAARRGTGPLLGFGWDSERWPEHRYPGIADLDRVPTDRPIAIWRVCGHVAVVNSTAHAGLPAPDPAGNGSRGRENGTPRPPDGILREEQLRRLDPLRQQAAAADGKGPARVARQMVQFGVTTIASLTSDLAEVDRVAMAHASDPLPVRVRFYLRPSGLPDVGRARDRLSGSPHSIVGLKIHTDGSLGARTAWLSEPYSDEPEGHGAPVGRAEEIADWLIEGARLGLQPALHAIGDRALFRALRLLEAHAGRPGARIEHASMASPPLFPLIDRVGAHLVVQPRFISSDYWIVDRLGPSRTRWAYAFRSLLDYGFSLAGSSDAPFDSPDPWAGMASAVGPRPHLGPGVDATSESLTPVQALGLYHHGAAAALEEPEIGSLEPGARADLVILGSRRPLEAIPVGAGAVQETWVDGRRVHDAAARGPSR